MTDEFGVQEAAKMAGTTPGLLRMWEMRYGWPTPSRKANGYRVYTRAQIALIRRVVDLVACGYLVSKLLVNGQVRWPPSSDPRPQPKRLDEIATAPRLQREESERRRALLVAALRNRATGHVEMLLIECAARVHPDDRAAAGWIPALVGLAAWDACGRPMPTAADIRSFIREQVGADAYEALVVEAGER